MVLFTHVCVCVCVCMCVYIVCKARCMCVCILSGLVYVVAIAFITVLFPALEYTHVVSVHRR